MKGVQFVVNERGKKTAVVVVIDLKTHSKLWEDFYDAAVARERQGEPNLWRIRFETTGLFASMIDNGSLISRESVIGEKSIAESKSNHALPGRP